MLVESRTLRSCHAAHVEDNRSVNDSGQAIGRQMIRSLLRHDDKVRVGDTISVNEVADALTRELLLHPATYALCHAHYSLSHIIRQISEVVDMSSWNDEAFPWGGWLQAHECSDCLVAIDETRRCFVRENLAEDAAHDGKCGLIRVRFERHK